MQDIELEIKVQQDKMSAYLSISPKSKNVKIKYEDLVSYLAENKIVFGLDEFKLRNIASNFNLLKKKISSVRIAGGSRAGLGNNDNIFFDYCNSNTIEEKYDSEQQFFDENDFDLPENINEGDKLLTIKRKQEMFSGKNIYDEILPAAEGEFVNLKPLRGVKTDQDELAYFADITGQVVFTPEGVAVLPVKEIRGNIDKQYGDLHYDGNIMIRGSVLDGRKVTAKGNIIVYGTVCEAEVRASGNIKIKSAILGKKRALVIADGDVLAGSIQNAFVEAKRNILVAGDVASSELIAEKTVIIKKTISSNVRVNARKNVFAKRIGSDITKNIFITCGLGREVSHKAMERRQQMIQYKSKLIQINNGLKQILKTYGSMEKIPAKYKPQVQVNYQNLQKLKTALKKLETDIKTLENPNTRDTQPEIETEDLYPGTIIQYFEQAITCQENKKDVNIFLNEDSTIDFRSIEEAHEDDEED